MGIQRKVCHGHWRSGEFKPEADNVLQGVRETRRGRGVFSARNKKANNPSGVSGRQSTSSGPLDRSAPKLPSQVQSTFSMVFDKYTLF